MYVYDAKRFLFLVSATPPWVTRVEEVKAAVAINVEAERKVAQMNEEIQGLARGIRARDQTIQESNVKIELMERRMDTVKKQADTIFSLETEIAKSRKQERSYEEAIEQLQSDLDALEQDNAKLKQITAGMERQREFDSTLRCISAMLLMFINDSLRRSSNPGARKRCNGRKQSRDIASARTGQ